MSDLTLILIVLVSVGAGYILGHIHTLVLLRKRGGRRE